MAVLQSSSCFSPAKNVKKHASADPAAVSNCTVSTSAGRLKTPPPPPPPLGAQSTSSRRGRVSRTTRHWSRMPALFCCFRVVRACTCPALAVWSVDPCGLQHAICNLAARSLLQLAALQPASQGPPLPPRLGAPKHTATCPVTWTLLPPRFLFVSIECLARHSHRSGQSLGTNTSNFDGPAPGWGAWGCGFPCYCYPWAVRIYFADSGPRHTGRDTFGERLDSGKHRVVRVVVWPAVRKHWKPLALGDRSPIIKLCLGSKTCAPRTPE